MANQPRSEIYSKVVELLKKGSYTTLQIADNTSINWETAKNAVETLAKINLIKAEERNGKTYYMVDESNFLQLRKDTLLGLPLTREQQQATTSLLARIREKWNEITGKPINKTFQQKILVRLVQDNKIPDVPYGWYLFGECAVLFNPDELAIPNHNYDAEIIKLVKEYQQFTNTRDLMHYDYTRKGNDHYLKKLQISTLLIEPFTLNSLSSLKRTVRDFLFTFPGNEDNKEIVELLNAFASMVFRLVNHKNEKEMEDLRPLLNETFSALWELMATYNLYLSLKDQPWYEKATVQRYYKLRTEILQPGVENYLTVLNDHTPNLEIPKDDPFQKFRGILALQSQ